MLKNIPIIVLLFVMAASAFAQRNAPASKSELAEITERGRQLAEYDFAAWHSTDAVMELKPEQGSVTRYIAKKTETGWTVVFGRLNEQRDKFLIAYEAVSGKTPQEFNAKKHEKGKEDSGFYLFAARAIDLAQADFKREDRPYNVAVLTAKSGQLYVYLMPAQTKEGVYPLGGDARYLISQDGAKILEKRQLHKAILEFSVPDENKKPEAGYHIAVLDDVPEDTDVLHVLLRKPSFVEWVATKNYVYRIETDGTINYLKPVQINVL